MTGAKFLDWPPVWLLAHMALAWVLALVWAPLNIEGRIIGGLVIILSLALMGWTAVTLSRAGTTIVPGGVPTALVTSGPFAISRNPIYLADLGVLFGFALAVGQPLAIVLVWPLKAVLEARFIRHEEAVLMEHDPEAFKEYAGVVSRWF